MGLIEHEGGEVPLSEMTTQSFAEVDRARKTAVDLADFPFPSVGRLRNRDRMDMIGHHAVRPDLDIVSAAPLGHESQVALVIFVRKERLLWRFSR